ncbi:class I SAM-dependent methyltransferase [Pedobacter glucosidilyticus]|uniref:class I SAM-dependent methyltransferase n=1 Tax=Pedobacter glucosidilyticus TaxID=1122941 RepID=UPI0026ED63CB|nr:class I SAM-dependent methyltransferase [Pedobacter glucosidilyticus]
MFSKIFRKLVDISPNLSLKLWQFFYNIVAIRFSKLSAWKYMNYGFSDQTNLSPESYEDLSANLYKHLFNKVDFSGKDSLEVGCGRGGGCDLLLDYHPKSITGLDFSAKGIKFCQKTYHEKPLTFVAGNAEDIPFQDHSFDVVINVESSHCYGNRIKFFEEVYRVLRPGGYFLYADFMGTVHYHKRPIQLVNVGFTIQDEQDITANVLRSMDKSANYKIEMVEKNVPKPFRKAINDFVGVPGSNIYDNFSSKKSTYFSFICIKPSA